MKTGERIKQVRKHSNLSQKDFGISIGVSTSSISAYEANNRVIPTDVLHTMCVKYSVSSDYILGLSNTYTYLKTEKKHPVLGEEIENIFKIKENKEIYGKLINDPYGLMDDISNQIKEDDKKTNE